MGISVRWMVTSRPESSTGSVGARVLQSRLECVWSLLCKVATEHDHLAEDVHQLRVATRRSLVAIELFGKELPKRQRRWFESRLRRIRRTAGEARDLDVLIPRLDRDVAEANRARSNSDSKRGEHARDAKRMSRLLTMLVRRRDASRRPIRELHAILVEEDWPHRVHSLLDEVGSQRRPFGRYARTQLSAVMKRFFRLADKSHRDAKELHELRIEGKKLRYAIEICGVVFDTATRGRLLEVVEELQKRLGEFTDHAAAADRFRCWRRQQGSRAFRADLARLQRRETKLADDARKAFTSWWTHRRRRRLCRRIERSIDWD